MLNLLPVTVNRNCGSDHMPSIGNPKSKSKTTTHNFSHSNIKTFDMKCDKNSPIK